MKNEIRFTIICIILSLFGTKAISEELICAHHLEGATKASIKPGKQYILNFDIDSQSIQFIPPSQSDVYALCIYVSFPDDPTHQELPSFYSNIEDSIQSYFEEMSNNSHHLHLSTAIRPAPNQTKCYIADNPAWYYASCYQDYCVAVQGLPILVTEIFEKVHNDNPAIFTGIEMVFFNMTMRIFQHHTAYSGLGSHSSPYYTGPGTSQYFIDQDGLEWSIAHEYGHQLGLSHPPDNDQKKYYGMYNLMYNRHQTNASGEGGANPFCGYDLYFHLNWLPASRFVDVTSDLFNESIGDIRTSGKLYRLTINSTYNEHLFIESHQGTGSDGLYNGTGLLIWHRRGSTILDIECASGQWSGSNPDPLTGTDALDDNIDVVYNGSADDFFDGMGNDNFSQLTNPCTNGYSVSSRHAAENILSHKAILNIIKVGSGSSEIKADFITNFWAGNIISNTSWNSSTNPYYIGGNIIVSDATTLTITTGAVVNLNGNVLKITGTGSIIRQTGSIFNPDIRLLNGTTLKGQYPTIQAAMADATSSDQIIVYSNITVTGTLLLACNVLVESGASVTFENSTTTLNGKSIRAVNGTLVASNATFAPDIRLVCGASRKGQYPTVQSALADATSSDEVQIYTSSNLSGQLTVPCDLRVAPSRQLTIIEGSTLTFASGKKLIVQGILEAVGGGSSTRVTLTSNSSWEGVWANGGDWGDASVDLKWTDISHATYGLHLDYKTETELSHCRLQYNETGIYAYGGANVSVSGSSGIINNEEEGIFGDYIDLYCSWSMIQYNGGDGCYLIDCEATIERMSFKNNDDGIYYRNEGTLDMGTSCSDKGYNKMYPTYGCKVAVINFATALANGNYWGIDGFSWDDICVPGGSHFYENCPLSSPPLVNSVANIGHLNKNSVVEAITGDPSSIIQYACQLRNDSLYADAVAILKPLVESTTMEPLWRIKALKELERNYNWAKWRKNGLEPAGKVTDYLDKIILENASGKAEACDALYRVALELKLKQNMREQHLEQAIQIGEELIQNYPNSFTEEHRLFDLFNLYLLAPNQSKRSEEYLAQLKTKYPKSRLIKHAENKLQAEQNYANLFPLIKDAQALNHKVEILPDTYTLSPCFPNPFNSATRIQYSLPEPAKVTLEVINQLGQTVLLLVEADQPAGRYEYNLQAEALSSGLYFIKLAANHFQQIQKVVLLR